MFQSVFFTSFRQVLQSKYMTISHNYNLLPNLCTIMLQVDKEILFYVCITCYIGFVEQFVGISCIHKNFLVLFYIQRDFG